MLHVARSIEGRLGRRMLPVVLVMSALASCVGVGVGVAVLRLR